MPTKSGKERKAKRKVKQELEAQLPAVWQATTEQEERQNNAIIKQSLRWKTDATREQLGENNQNKTRTSRDIAILVTRRLMLSADAEVSLNAVKNLIAMEAQNQKDDQPPKEASGQFHNHLHVNGSQFSQASDQDVIEGAKILDRIKNK